MGKEFPLTPKKVAKVDTKFRRIVTDIPVPASVSLLEKLRANEARSMRGQPPVIWDHAKGVNVFDPYGNMWLDFSSGVLITNAGHGHPAIAKAIADTANRVLVASYCFPNAERAGLVEALARVAPEPCKKVFLLSTGAEATECCMKLAMTWGQKISKSKHVVVSFVDGFHGRTMGAQMMGGSPALKAWIPPDVASSKSFVQVPYPDGFRQTDVSFKVFEQTLAKAGVKPADVCAVITETYPGGSCKFLPVEYAKAMRAWCDKNGALMIFDEVQAGFGRCGKWFGFEHYGVKADLIACGKGISSSLPLSAVIGRPEIMDQYEPGTMTSTHSGSPICAAAALASLSVIEKEGLVENAAKVGDVLQKGLDKLMAKYPKVVGMAAGKGLVGSLQIVKPGMTDPDADLAFDIVSNCIEQGLLFFAPVGKGGGSVKIAPPLCITEEAMLDGLGVLDAAMAKAIAGTSTGRTCPCCAGEPVAARKK
ncbi:MAG: aspartate aminotransferase family protein [Phycisphaerae bacterium]|nr:aspartate aminotransferase family protein [Phycisphaerae bacterium]